MAFLRAMHEAGRNGTSQPYHSEFCMGVFRKGILGSNSGQGSIEYLLICVGALVISGIFFYAVRDTIRVHTLSISNHYL